MPRFHFAVSHLQDAESLQINLQGRIFDLTPHTEESWAAARNDHPALSLANEDTAKLYAHFSDIPDEQFSDEEVRWVQVVRPQQPGSHLNEVVLMSQIIPPTHLRAFYHSPMWKERHVRRHGLHAPHAIRVSASKIEPHLHGRLHALGIKANLSADDQAVETLVSLQELVDPDTTAAGLLAHHPELATVQKSTAAYIRDMHIFPDPTVNPDQYNSMQTLSNEMAKTPSWGPIVDCKDKDGNPIKAQYNLGTFKEGDQLQTFSVAPNVLAAATPAFAGAQRSSSDDMQLQNHLWSPTPGRSVIKSSDHDGTRLRKDTRFKWTVPLDTYTNGIKLDKDTLSLSEQNEISLDFYNVYNRTVVAAYELFDDKGNSMGPRKDLGSISPVNMILGIPIPIVPTTEKFNIGNASSIKVYLGSLGASNWDTAIDLNNVSVNGAILTCAFQYAIPMVMSYVGSAITSTETFNKIVSDKQLVAAALGILFPIVGGGVATAAALTNWKSVMLKFGDVVISFALQKGMEELGKWLLEQVGKAALSKAFGPVGWACQLVAAGLNIEMMAITTVEVAMSDSLTVAEIKRAIDVSLKLHPDPAHGESGHSETAVWPSVATNYVATLQCQSGTNFEIKGTLPSTTSNTPIPITFSNVPAGGNIRIIIGLYSDNGWLAGSWENSWMLAEPNKKGALDLGDKNIKENLVPLGIDTQYVYKNKIAYTAPDFSWDANSTPPATTQTSLNCSNNGGLCELTALTINNSAFQVGYAWRAANQHLQPDSSAAPVTDDQLYSVQNLSVLAEPGQRLKTTKVGFTHKPGIAYAPSTNAENVIDPNNFILDPRNGVINLRKVVLDNGNTDFGLGDQNLRSWGSFPLDNLDAVAIHPSNAVLACSFSSHKLMILKLPAESSRDGEAPEARMVSGKGIREGLMQGPKALAVAPDGRILVLESLNDRVQAFDILGNAVPCFTPKPSVFTLNTAEVAASLDAKTVPAGFVDGLIQAGENYVGPLVNSSFIAELDGGKFRAKDESAARKVYPLINELAALNINLAYDPATAETMSDPKKSSQIKVVQKGQSWIITDPRQQAWEILNQSGLLNVYKRPAQIEVEVQKPGNRWLLRDNSIGLAWILQVSSGSPNLVETFNCFTYFPLQTGPNGANLNYLDMAVESQGYMYVLSYINDGAATTDYLLDVYEPNGMHLFRSPDASKSSKSQNIVAGRIAVDIWRDLYALSYETLKGPGGGTQPGLAHWMPTPPLFSFPLTEQENFNTPNISAIKADFAAHKITLSDKAFIDVKNRDGYWQVKDGTTIYHVYRTGDALQVYSVSA